MKKVLSNIIIICLIISTITCGVLWQKEKNNLSDIKRLAQGEANNAYESFVDYSKENDENIYWDAVASFRSFEQAYHILVEDTNHESNYIFCNEVYGHLINHPIESQKCIKEIIEVMKVIANDVEDGRGYSLMANLRNHINN